MFKQSLQQKACYGKQLWHQIVESQINHSVALKQIRSRTIDVWLTFQLCLHLALQSHFSNMQMFSGEGNANVLQLGIRYLLSSSLKPLFNIQEPFPYSALRFPSCFWYSVYLEAPRSRMWAITAQKGMLWVLISFLLVFLQFLALTFKGVGKLTGSRLCPSSTATGLVFLNKHTGKLGQRSGSKWYNHTYLMRRRQVIVCWCEIFLKKTNPPCLQKNVCT